MKKPTTKSRLLAKLAVVLAFSMLAAACSSSGSTETTSGGSTETTSATEAPATTEAPSGEIVELRFVNWASAEETTRDNMLKVIAAFEAEYPNIKIINEPTPFAEKEQKLLTAVAGGNPPDIAQVAQVLPFDLFRAGALLDIEAAGLIDDAYLADSYPAAIESSRADTGELIAVPWILTTYGLVYDKSLVDGRPETIEDLRAAAEKAVAESPDVIGVGLETVLSGPVVPLEFYPYFFAFGANPMYGAPNMDTPETIAALTWLQGLMNDGLSKPGLGIRDFRELSAQRKLGMYIEAPVVPGLIGALNPDLAGDAVFDAFAVAPFPCGPAGCGGGSLANMHQLVIFSDTQYPAEAWEFVKFLVQSDISINEYQVPMGAIPASVSATLNSPSKEALDNSIMKVFIEEILPQQKPAPYGPNFSAALPIFEEALQRVLLAGDDPAEVARDAEERMLAIWK